MLLNIPFQEICPHCRKFYVHHEHPLRPGVVMRKTCGCTNPRTLLLETLHQIMRDRLPGLLADPNTPWETLDVLYEDPHVERLWLQLEENRLYLHRIHPCTKAFFHPHPWSSAVHIVKEPYIMLLGQGSPTGTPPTPCARIVLAPGSSYEMSEATGWHSVQPFAAPSLSLMLTGRPWVMPSMQHPQKSANRPLSDATRADMIEVFSQHFPLLSDPGL